MGSNKEHGYMFLLLNDCRLMVDKPMTSVLEGDGQYFMCTSLPSGIKDYYLIHVHYIEFERIPFGRGVWALAFSPKFNFLRVPTTGIQILRIVLICRLC